MADTQGAVGASAFRKSIEGSTAGEQRWMLIGQHSVLRQFRAAFCPMDVFRPHNHKTPHMLTILQVSALLFFIQNVPKYGNSGCHDHEAMLDCFVGCTDVSLFNWRTSLWVRFQCFVPTISVLIRLLEKYTECDNDKMTAVSRYAESKFWIWEHIASLPYTYDSDLITLYRLLP